MEAKIWNYSGWINNTDPNELKNKLSRLLDKAGFTILGEIDHEFQPQGYTKLWLLAESHFAIHTFPEHGATYLELSSCNEDKMYAFMNELPYKFDILLKDPDETETFIIPGTEEKEENETPEQESNQTENETE